MRNISENNGVSSIDYSYLDNYDLLDEKIDGNNISEAFEYSGDLTKLIKVEKSNSEINNLYNNDGLLIKTSNDSEINISYDAFGLESSVSILTGTGFKYFLLQSNSLGFEDQITCNNVTHKYNKYGYIKKISPYDYMMPPSYNNSSLCDFYYFKTRPNNIEDIDEQDETELVDGAKLYIINDYLSNRRTHFTYNADNSITELEILDISNSNIDSLYKWTTEYDSFGRVYIKQYSFSTSPISLHYCRTTYSYSDNISFFVGIVSLLIIL